MGNHTKMYVGIFTFLILLSFGLAGCDSNNEHQEEQPALTQEDEIEFEQDNTNEQAPLNLDELTKRFQARFGEEQKYRVREKVVGSPDEVLVFYADVPEGAEAAVYHLNVRTGTVVDGISGSPLDNIILKEAPDLKDLQGEDYISALDGLTAPLIREKGYSLDGDSAEPYFTGFIGDGFIEYEVPKLKDGIDQRVRIQLDPFTKEFREPGNEGASREKEPVKIAEAPDYAERDAGASLDQLKKRGFNVIEDQSFGIDLEPWGKSRFVSGFYSVGEIKRPVFYILSSEQKVVYTLPPSDQEEARFEGILAVGFKDMNGDEQKDIVIIGDYLATPGKQGEHRLPLVSVYFSIGDSYALLPWYNELLNDSGKSDTIGNAVKQGRLILNKFKNVSKSDDTQAPLDLLASWICTEQVLDTGEYDDMDLQNSVYVFSQTSTFTDSYIAYAVAERLGEGRDAFLHGDKDLLKKVNQYDELLTEILGDISVFNYIESGGGTIWQIINAYTELNKQSLLTKYAKDLLPNESSKLKNGTKDLKNEWTAFHAKLKSTIKDKRLVNDFFEAELTEYDMEQLQEIEERLPKTMDTFLKHASKDPKSLELMGLVLHSFELGY